MRSHFISKRKVLYLSFSRTSLAGHLFNLLFRFPNVDAPQTCNKKIQELKDNSKPFFFFLSLIALEMWLIMQGPCNRNMPKYPTSFRALVNKKGKKS